MDDNRIKHALDALEKELNESILNNQQKIALKSAIDKLRKYYEKKIQEIAKTNGFYVSRNKEFKLTSVMVECIVGIDDALKGYADPNIISSNINRVVNYVEKKKLLRKK
jgi:hypothetical protein